MHSVARKALERLLRSSENAAAKETATARAIQLQFSAASFPDYLGLSTHKEKTACNSALRLANSKGAITINWDTIAGEYQHITSISLVDGAALAGVLGVVPRWDGMAAAKTAFASYTSLYPVLHQVLDTWNRGAAIRSTKVSSDAVQKWLDAVKVVQACRALDNTQADIPIRSLSTRLFNNSKYIQELCPLIDVLTQGQVGGLSRHPEEVFQQLGLCRFPLTMLIAANACAALKIALDDDVLSLPSPYLGLYPPAIRRVMLSSEPVTLLTIENLSTFHESLRDLHLRTESGLVIIYTGGMPSPSWRRVYKLFMASMTDTAQILHWGDVDAGGLRIADVLASDCAECGKSLRLHNMGIQPAAVRKALTAAELSAIQAICTRRGWNTELAAIFQHKSAIEQESLAVSLPE